MTHLHHIAEQISQMTDIGYRIRFMQMNFSGAVPCPFARPLSQKFRTERESSQIRNEAPVINNPNINSAVVTRVLTLSVG